MKVISPCVKILFCIVGSDITTKTGTTYKYCVTATYPRCWIIRSTQRRKQLLKLVLFALRLVLLRGWKSKNPHMTSCRNTADMQQLQWHNSTQTNSNSTKCKQIRLTCDRRRLGWRSHSLDEPEQVTDERILQRTQQTVSYQVLLANCYR